MTDYIYSIEANNVNKTFNRKDSKIEALRDFKIKIKKGSIHGLLGPNGAGKSTFINILGGLVKKNTGNIKICGIDIDKNLKLAKFKIGIVPQELNIDPFFTPYELLEIQAGLFGVPKKNRRTNEILKLLALEDKSHAYARTLSGGMRRRLLIAKAMVHDPEILILDEPTAGVDVELRANLWTNINRLNNEGKTIIITTHYLHEAEELCNEIAIIDNGNLITKDTTSNIKSLIDRKQIIISLDSKNYNLDPIMGLNVECEINCDYLIINYKPSEISFNKILDALQLSSIQVKDLTINETKLEDVFLKLTKN